MAVHVEAGIMMIEVIEAHACILVDRLSMATKLLQMVIMNQCIVMERESATCATPTLPRIGPETWAARAVTKLSQMPSSSSQASLAFLQLERFIISQPTS